MKKIRFCAAATAFLLLLSTSVPVYAGTWTAHEDKTWSYVNDEGESVKGWIKEDGKTYYLDENGVLLTGWIEDSEKTYYLDEEGVLKTGWFKLKGSWYYFDEDGVLAKNTWIDNYYVNSEGKMKGIR